MTVNRLVDMTTVDADVAVREARLAILPVGAIEQHGPHLALQTDARIAEAFASRLAAELGPVALLCPLVPYGISEHHARFAGTITVSPTTYMALLLDLVASLASQGLDRVVIVNGHGGNIEALSLVARQARSQMGVRVASMMWAKLAGDVCAEAASGSAYGHACETETSLAMALAPELVRTDRIAPPAPRPQLEPHSAPPRALVDVAVRFDELTTDGVYGDPTHASLELGERILSTALRRATEFCREFQAAAD